MTPIIPGEGSYFVIDENSADCLRVRTRITSWWLGGLGLIGMIWWIGACLQTIWGMLADGNWLPALWVFLALVLGGGFCSLFALGLTSERLRVARGILEYRWCLGPIPLKRKRAAFAEIKDLSCAHTSSESDVSGAYYLDIKTLNWDARFGTENTDATIEEVQHQIRRLQKAGKHRK